MRDKSLLQLFLALNVALAACFVVYLFLSSSSQPAVTSTSFVGAPPKTNSAAKRSDPPGRSAVAVPSTNSVVESASNAPAVPDQPLQKPVFTQKRFGWERLEKDEETKSGEYQTYLGSLRAVGCPEDKIRYIVMADINELFAKRCLKEAVAHDPQWWRTDPEISVAGALQERGRTLEEQRHELI